MGRSFEDDQSGADGLKVNLSECEWAAKETDFLGCWMTPQGVQPHDI